jgi:hypothetical protein
MKKKNRKQIFRFKVILKFYENYSCPRSQRKFISHLFYRKRLQELLENLQQMQQTQLEQKELLMQQQQQQQQQQNRPPLIHQRPVSSSSKRSSASGGRTSAVPPKTPSQLQPSTMVSPSLGVSQDIGMLPKTPGTYDTLTPIGLVYKPSHNSSLFDEFNIVFDRLILHIYIYM